MKTSESPHYHCRDCNREWLILEVVKGREVFPKMGCQCPFCGSKYVKWLNFEKEKPDG